jgi:Zn-dependent protease
MLLLSLLNSPSDLIAIIIGFLLIGLPIHEFAHAWVANRFGDPTAKLSGRLTLNPFAHLDLLGTFFFFMFGFGWGKPVPINPRYFHKKEDELKVAIAGIIANLLIAAILAVPIRIALLHGQLIDSSPILSFLSKIVDINIVLAAFNILPIPPLDGSHFVEYFLTEEQKYRFHYVGQYLLIGLFLYGLLSGYSIIYAVMEPIIRIFSLLIKGTYSNFF